MNERELDSVMGDKELESYLEAINNNDYKQFESNNLCKELVETLKTWESIPEEVQLEIIKNLVPKDGIY